MAKSKSKPSKKPTRKRDMASAAANSAAKLRMAAAFAGLKPATRPDAVAERRAG